MILPYELRFGSGMHVLTPTFQDLLINKIRPLTLVEDFQKVQKFCRNNVQKLLFLIEILILILFNFKF